MPDQHWYQQSLVTPEVLEVNIRVGLIPAQDHVQVLAEMKDPVSGVLVAQWSTHHETMHRLPRVLDDARRRIDAWLADAVEPF